MQEQSQSALIEPKASAFSPWYLADSYCFQPTGLSPQILGAYSPPIDVLEILSGRTRE